MKNKVFIIALMLTILFSVNVHAQEVVETAALPNGLGISASSAIIIDSDNLAVHYSHDADTQRPMASTTKIMTALLIIENIDNLDEEIITTEKMVQVEGTSMGLLAGDTVSYRSLLYGIMLESGNDAANTAAIACSGSIEEFAVLMNAKAKEIGLKNTNFVNPSGLPDDAHYSTAHDMALLGASAMKNDVFAEICGTKSIQVQFGNPPQKRTLSNHNRLVREERYDGANGIKTGFTKKAGRCLVSSVTKNGANFVCVTLNAPDDWNDHTKMYDYAISMYKPFTPDTNIENIGLEVIGGTKENASVRCNNEMYETMIASEWETSLVRQITMKKFEYAPIKEGTQIGAIEYLYDGKAVVSVPIYAGESVAAITTGWFSSHISAITS